MDLLNNSPEFDAFFEEHRTLFEYVSTHSGKEMTKDDIYQAIEDINNIHDTLFVEVNLTEFFHLKCIPFSLFPNFMTGNLLKLFKCCKKSVSSNVGT